MKLKVTKDVGTKDVVILPAGTVIEVEEVGEDLVATAVSTYMKPKDWPQKGDKYYFIGFNGEIAAEIWVGKANIGDTDNMFRTKEEAEKMKDKIKELLCDTL